MMPFDVSTELTSWFWLWEKLKKLQPGSKKLTLRKIKKLQPGSKKLTLRKYWFWKILRVGFGDEWRMSRIGVYEWRMSRMGLGHQVNGFGAYGVDGWAVGFGSSTLTQNKKVKNGYRGRRQNVWNSSIKLS